MQKSPRLNGQWWWFIQSKFSNKKAKSIKPLPRLRTQPTQFRNSLTTVQKRLYSNHRPLPQLSTCLFNSTDTKETHEVEFFYAEPPLFTYPLLQSRKFMVKNCRFILFFTTYNMLWTNFTAACRVAVDEFWIFFLSCFTCGKTKLFTLDFMGLKKSVGFYSRIQSRRRRSLFSGNLFFFVLAECDFINFILL